MSPTKRKIRLIIRELGRVNSRLNTLHVLTQDKELVDEIAELIAQKHAFKKKSNKDLIL